MIRNCLIISPDIDLVNFNDNLIIPELYYKIRFKDHLKNYDDYSKSYVFDKKDKDVISELCDRLLNSIKQSILEQYDIELSQKQIKFCFSYMIKSYIYFVYEKYYKILEIKNKYNDAETEIYNLSKEAFICDKFPEIYNLVQSDIYNTYILKKICEKIGIKINYKSRQNSENDVISKSNTLNIKRLFYIIKKLFKYNIFFIVLNKSIRIQFFEKISRLFSNSFLLSTSFFNIPNKAKVLIMKTYMPISLKRSVLKKTKCTVIEKDMDFFIRLESKLLKNAGDTKIRSLMLKYFEPTNKFEELIKENILDVIPRISLEFFTKCYEYGNRIANKCSNIEKFYCAAGIGGFESSTIVNILAAILSKRYCRIIDIQHSAGYGAVKNLYDYEMDCYDEFVSWGKWHKEINDQRLRECRNIRYVGSSHKGAVNKNKILYVTDGAYRYNFGVCKHSDSFVDRHFRLLKLLPHDIRKMITVRLRDDYLLLEKVYRQEFPEIEIERLSDRTKSFEESAFGRQLVIIDTNSSPFYECLLNNIPVILYEAFQFDEYTDCMYKFYKKMSSAKIYFDIPEDCADEIVKFISSNTNYFNHERTNLSKEILEFFFNENLNYVDLWSNEFLNN